MKNLRGKKGITLISLIVTIIILLILAGISIGLISGSNGILTRASKSLDANEEATAREKIELKLTYLNMVAYGEHTRKATLQEIADGLCSDKEMQYVKLKNQEIASLEPIDVTGESSIFVKLKEYPYEFEINEKLHLASVDGVKIEDSSSDSISEEKINQILDSKVNAKLEKVEEKIANLQNDVQVKQNVIEELQNKVNVLENEITKENQKKYKSGVANIGAINGSSFKLVEIKFDTPFDDANYAVTTTCSSEASCWTYITYTIINKTKNGFVLKTYNSVSAVSGNITTNWIAIPYNK